MPNSAPALKAAILAELGLDDAEPLFGQIPEDHRLREALPLPLPPAITSEVELSRHLRGILAKNRHCLDNISFLGGGCWQHHVPAVVDEIVGRSEFLTPVWGTPSSDLGRNQAWFEFTSQLGALLGMEMVGLPVYSWGCAAGHAIRMAARITGRGKVLVPAEMSPERRMVVDNYCAAAGAGRAIEVVAIATDSATGRLDLGDLDARLGADVAAVYFENPAYLGMIESDAAAIVEAAHKAGALAIVGVDPISLGVLSPPSDYGADIAVGSTQPLGVHMHGGGGLGGFIASRDEAIYAHEYPTLLNSMTRTAAGERVFAMSLMHQSSYGAREEGKDWTGNSTYLWAIANAAYMALLGPLGFRELGALILRRAHDAARQIASVPGISVAHPSGFFKEFVVDFGGTGQSLDAIDEALRVRGIFGGIDLGARLPGREHQALYCVTECHSPADIDRLVTALREVCA
ncbi:aminomethyl-transferring glycine dehydrogenase subunit GcvPA [Sphingomonas baiyangensis]|uniref:Aminomethyl-transferring glycine dehydrogenase subunit GcvPA n=2 Tax=Sphingomonas baiyangensis TaxID=2572576 RepID=A0A4V5PU08_9SPHN|nr:aminomethyl-transferring glycine dehydrogenase subunit GcvPA [Sphingomonas baiyangensis]